MMIKSDNKDAQQAKLIVNNHIDDKNIMITMTTFNDDNDNVFLTVNQINSKQVSFLYYTKRQNKVYIIIIIIINHITQILIYIFFFLRQTNDRV